MQILVLRFHNLCMSLGLNTFWPRTLLLKAPCPRLRDAGSYSNIYIGLVAQQPGISLKEHLKYNSFLKGKEGNQIL